VSVEESIEELAHDGADGGEDDGIVDEVGEGDVFLFGERVLPGGEELEGEFEERFVVEDVAAGFFGFVGADGDVGDLFLNDGDEVLGGGELDLQLDVGKGGGEFLDRFGEMKAEEVLRGGDDEVGRELGAAFVEEAFKGVDGLDVGLDDVEEELAFGGEFDGAAFAAEERAAEHAFEGAELFPDGGGGESEFAGGDGEVAFAGGEAEAAQLRELHVFVAVGTSHANGGS